MTLQVVQKAHIRAPFCITVSKYTKLRLTGLVLDEVFGHLRSSLAFHFISPSNRRKIFPYLIEYLYTDFQSTTTKSDPQESSASSS